MAESLLTKCRTCLKAEKNFQLLEEQIGLKSVQATYKDALIALTNITIQIDQEKHMPQRICHVCSRKLRAAQQFINQAQDANYELLSLLRGLQRSSPKQLDCLKEPCIDLDANKYLQVKLEEEMSESHIIAVMTENPSTENLLMIKEESALHLKLEHLNKQQEISKANCVVPIDPLPEDVFTEKCNNILDRVSTIVQSERCDNLKKNGKDKPAKTKSLDNDDLLPVGCDDCGKIYENAKQLARHKKSAHLPEELKIPCPNCGRKFSRKCNLYTHMRTFHGKESVEDLLRPPDSLIARKKYQCDKCPCKYTNIHKLHAHIRRKHDAATEEVNSTTKIENYKVKKTYTFLCTICGMSCSSQTALKLHTRRHTGEKPFKCNLCDKAYARSYDLLVHRRIHTGEKPLKCSICSKAFRRSDILTDHMRTHSNERPYKCTQCKSCFKRPKELTIHMRIHTGERPYKCDVCFNTFTQRISLKAHRMKYGHIENSNCNETMTLNAGNKNISLTISSIAT